MKALNDQYKSRLRRCIFFLLKPLVRLLMRSGVGYSDFAEWAKFSYVDVAENEFSLEGRSPSTSRISILTGLHRKEVARIRKQLSVGNVPEKITSANRAERVINAWLREPDYSTEANRPSDLPLTPDSRSRVSFESLVKRFSGDIHSSTLLDELFNIDAVEKTSDGLLRLKSTGYIPRVSSPEQLDIVGQSVHDLMATLDNNIDPNKDRSFFQRSVAYHHLSQETVERFKHYSEQENQKLLLKLNKWLAQHDMKKAEQESAPIQYRAGVGIYYFEEPGSEKKPI